MQNYYGPATKFLSVRPRPGQHDKGLLLADGRTMPCALGRSGIGIKRGEGDGITPWGRFRLLFALIRRDKIKGCNTRLLNHSISPQDGWCDAPGDRNYNLPVPLPYPASHEKLWRGDDLYDIAIVMDFNFSTRMQIGGSAIFFHIARPNYSPTEGCVAISRTDMLWLLPRLDAHSVMTIGT